MQNKKEALKNIPPESTAGLGNIILACLVLILVSVFVYYLKDNRLFIILTFSIAVASATIFLSAHFFFLRRQVYFDRWSDAIRYSRYPATMIITNFSMIAFIAWIKVSTQLGDYLNIPIFLTITLPFLFSSLCYGLCAYYTLIGNLFDKKPELLTKSGRFAIIYWKMGQIFLVSALVPMAALVVMIATFVI